MPSKLYLTGTSDTVKTEKTARGNEWIKALFGYDEKDFDKKIRVTMDRGAEATPYNRRLFIEKLPEMKTLAVCNIDENDNVRCKLKDVEELK